MFEMNLEWQAKVLSFSWTFECFCSSKWSRWQEREKPHFKRPSISLPGTGRSIFSTKSRSKFRVALFPTHLWENLSCHYTYSSMPYLERTETAVIRGQVKCRFKMYLFNILAVGNHYSTKLQRSSKTLQTNFAGTSEGSKVRHLWFLPKNFSLPKFGKIRSRTMAWTSKYIFWNASQTPSTRVLYTCSMEDWNAKAVLGYCYTVYMVCITRMFFLCRVSIANADLFLRRGDYKEALTILRSVTPEQGWADFGLLLLLLSTLLYICRIWDF